MKKLSFLLVLVFASAMAFAQGGKVNAAIAQANADNLDKAKEAIDLAIVHEKTKSKAKTWKVKGYVYQLIAVSENADYAALSDDAINESLSAYEKAKELDVKNTFDAEITKNMTMFNFKLSQLVGADWEAKDFKSAFTKFEALVKISALMEPPVIDTVSIFNAGISAEKAGMKDEAMKYFQKAAEYKYGGDNVYIFMGNIQLESGDTVKYVETLKAGIDAYPEANKTVMSYLINHYITTNNAEAALSYLEKAIKMDPSNQTFYFAQGVMYDKLGEFDNAVAAYEKSIEVKADYHDGYYNLGALYVNRASEMLNDAQAIPPNEQDKYEAAKQAAFDELRNAVPSLEKAHELDPKEESTIAILKEIFFKLRNESDEYMAKYKEYQAKADGAAE